MIQFTQSENGTVNVKQDNAPVAGIARMGDAFTVTPAQGIAFDPESFATLDAAKHYVADQIGETLPRSAPAKRTRTSAAKVAPAKVAKVAAPAKRTSAAKDAKRSAPAKVRAAKVAKVPGEGMNEEQLAQALKNVGFANRYYRAQGRFDVYVDDATVLKAIQKKFRTIPAHVYGKNSVAPAGTANLYPNAEQADKIAKAFPNTDVAAQCIARGWKNWRIATREQSAA